MVAAEWMVKRVMDMDWSFFFFHIFPISFSSLVMVMLLGHDGMM